jgi:putative oxidoreductase
MPWAAARPHSAGAGRLRTIPRVSVRSQRLQKGAVAMPPKSIQFVAPLGRILLSLIFLASAAGKLNDWQGTLTMLTDKNLPIPEVLLAVAVVLEIVGGTLVVLGLYARLGAVALLLFLIPVTFILHNFWAMPEAKQMEQMINFMKNVSITGGVLMVLALGAGPVSIDSLRRKKPVVSP